MTHPVEFENNMVRHISNFLKFSNTALADHFLVGDY